ncbi:sterol desaturase family protein [Nocardia sp. NBC_00511]|uniref:sterol desaturase family protein n=1 Tax=Nocardia sp. NBC_00511 TaxID=2903591 RepID=UPI0030DEB8E1
MDYTCIFLFAFTAYCVALAVEWVSWRRVSDTERGNGFHGRDTVNSLVIGIVSKATRPLEALLVPFSFTLVAAAWTPIHLPADRWWTWAIGFAATDFCYYWGHRADHRVRLLWTAHSVHHSSEQFNLSTALRMPALMPFAVFLDNATLAPAALAGIPPSVILFWQTVTLLFQWPLHTRRIDMLPAPIEYLFNTPSHHRVHHGSNNPYLDKNYGGVLIVWDRVFGSYAHESDPVVYGLTRNIGTFNPATTNFHEFLAMLTDIGRAHGTRAVLRAVFGPPTAPIRSAITTHT